MAGSEDIHLSERLFRLDDRIDQINEYFEQLQLLTVDAAHPGHDLLSFAQDALMFSVILKKRPFTTGTSPGPGNHGGSYSNSQQHYSHGLFASSRNVPASEDDIQMTDTVTYDTNGDLDDYSPNRYNDFGSYPPSYSSFCSPQPCTDDIIGIIYLVNSTAFEDPLHLREANIGIFIDPRYRGNGYSRQVIQTVLDKAFNDFNLHRVQAILPHHVAKDRAICLFTSMRFTHEGTRRRAFWSAFENEYMDVSYMGLLDTEWVLRNRKARPAPRSVWDEMFARHQREREELLNWENRLPSPTLRKTNSMVTLRSSTPKPVETTEYLTDASQSGYSTDATDTSEDRASSTSSSGKGKRKMGDFPDTSRSRRQRRLFEADSDAESDAESIYSSASSHRSATPEGYSSNASWDAMDPPSSPSVDAEWDDCGSDEEL